MTLLNEMKNAQFKHGAKRSNFHNPVKSVAEFWAQQSDYQLQTLTTHYAVTSEQKSIVVSGPAETFSDSHIISFLLARSLIRSSEVVSFISELRLHCVPIRKDELVLLDGAVWYVLRMLRVHDEHYMLLRSVAPSVQLDEHGSYYIDTSITCASQSVRCLSLTGACTATGLWSIQQSDSHRLYVIPKY